MARRLRLRPLPDATELAGRSVHGLVRDIPEALAVLRRVGIDPGSEGGRTLGEVEGGQEAVTAVREAVAWRAVPPTTPSTGKMGGAEGASMADDVAPAAESPPGSS